MNVLSDFTEEQLMNLVVDLFNAKEQTDTYTLTFHQETQKAVNIVSIPKKAAIEIVLNQNIENVVISFQRLIYLQRQFPNKFDRFIIIGQNIAEDIDEKWLKERHNRNSDDPFIEIQTWDEIENELKNYPLLWKKYMNEDISQPKISIQSLHIENIKCFENTTIEFLEPSTILLGINGRGKTTILQLLALAFCNLRKPYQETEWTSILREQKKIGKLSLMIKIDQKTEVIDFEVDENEDLLCVSNREVLLTLKNKFFLGYGASREIGSLRDRKRLKYEDIASLFAQNDYFHSIKQSENYAFVKAYFDTIKKTINEVFQDADLHFELVRFDEKNFYFKSPTSPTQFISLEAMSAGFKSMFVWLFDMICRAWHYGIDVSDGESYKGIILIDEIDKHLHPAWQRRMVPTLQKIFPNMQFILTTHSPFIVQSLENSLINVLKITKNEVEVEKLLLTGKPFGYDLEKIVELLMAEKKDNTDYGISQKLYDLLQNLRQAVANDQKEQIREYYQQIMAAIPEDSDYRDYVQILTSEYIS